MEGFYSFATINNAGIFSYMPLETCVAMSIGEIPTHTNTKSKVYAFKFLKSPNYPLKMCYLPAKSV